ncbi:hypothetical protein PLESTB_000663100 [Pleodorina starrii]|uniref:Uncharacterized protein n=1 Tax=Pleodorina starrii TaxID=330485 RepID=A0A9W6BIE3_9CHLO|nr:hypothetical protein PLESTB_000663100 [Pleodorina starrii]
MPTSAPLSREGTARHSAPHHSAVPATPHQHAPASAAVPAVAAREPSQHAQPMAVDTPTQSNTIRRIKLHVRRRSPSPAGADTQAQCTIPRYVKIVSSTTAEVKIPIPTSNAAVPAPQPTAAAPAPFTSPLVPASALVGPSMALPTPEPDPLPAPRGQPQQPPPNISRIDAQLPASSAFMRGLSDLDVILSRGPNDNAAAAIGNTLQHPELLQRLLDGGSVAVPRDTRPEHFANDYDPRWFLFTHPEVFPNGTGACPKGMSLDAWGQLLLRRWYPFDDPGISPYFLIDLYDVWVRHEVSRMTYVKLQLTSASTIESIGTLTYEETAQVINLLRHGLMGAALSTELAKLPQGARHLFECFKFVNGRVRGTPWVFRSLRAHYLGVLSRFSTREDIRLLAPLWRPGASQDEKEGVQLRIGQLTITSDDGLITAVSIFNGNAVTPFLNTRLVGRRATIQVVPSTPPQLADPGPHDYRILNERGTFQLEEQAADDADPEPADQGLPVVTPNVTMLSPVDAPGQFHTAFVLVAERMDMAGDLDPDMAYDMPGLVLMKDVHGHFAADDSGYTFKVELPGRSDAQVANFTHKITTPAVRDRIYYVFRSSRYAISGHPYYGGNVHAGVCTADMGNALHDILCIVFEKAPNILNLTGLYNHDITGYFIPNPNKTITRPYQYM